MHHLDGVVDCGEAEFLPKFIIFAVEEAILAAILGSRERRDGGGNTSPGVGDGGGGVTEDIVPQPEESDEEMVMVLSLSNCLFAFNTCLASAGLRLLAIIFFWMSLVILRISETLSST